MKTVIHKLGMDSTKTYQRKKINFIHPPAINQFKETHAWFSKTDKKRAKYEHKLSMTTPNHMQARYELARYFVDQFNQNSPKWGSFKFNITK
jgi:hypothetical protein